tara:strand:+ start:3867 stop:4529 length:663 start_codon:yes stop_codon:yes gene_type:complete
MQSYKYDRAFFTGCDSNTEWQLKWFLENYVKHNKTPIVLADFGMTKETRTWAYQVSEFVDVIDVPKQFTNGWFLKPKTMRLVSAYERVWLDTDIHVLGNLDGIFDLIEDGKLAMVEDKPWTKRKGEKWHNSGVVGIRGNPPVLSDWIKECQVNPKQGDQEVLHEMLKNDIIRMKYITSLPNIYNWLRIQLLDGEDNPNKLCMHWTGLKGNMQIKRMMYNS